MAVKIGLVSKKGGPGKSTIARGLAVAFAQNDWAVKIADFDLGQKTSVEWVQTRMLNGHTPEVFAEPFASVAQALRIADQYDAIIFDGRPDASLIVADIAKASDLIIIPTGLATDDLRPAVVMADELHSLHGIPVNRIAFALNHVGDSAAELAEAQEYLGHKPYLVLDGHLPEMVNYRRAMDSGLSIIETRHKGPRAQAERVIQSIMTRINELTV